MLLVGFMACGKSTVGALLAERLGWTLVDFDDEVERRAGRTVAELFRMVGEPAFREMERAVGEEALHRSRVVLVPGGGWPALPGRMESVPETTLSVWLDVSAEVAVTRAGRDAQRRPLLEVSDPVGRARELLDARRPYYGRTHMHLSSDAATPDELAQRILDALDTEPESSPTTADC